MIVTISLQNVFIFPRNAIPTRHELPALGSTCLGQTPLHFVSINLTILGTSWVESHCICGFLMCLFHLAYCQVSSIVLHVSEFSSSLNWIVVLIFVFAFWYPYIHWWALECFTHYECHWEQSVQICLNAFLEVNNQKWNCWVPWYSYA